MTTFGPEISTRRELADALEQRMARSTAIVAESQRLEYEGNLLKTYVVEAHVADVAEPLDTLVSEVEDIFAMRKIANVSISDKEHALAQVDFVTQKQQARFYVDAANPRFWLVHTLSPSVIADRYLTQLVQRSIRLDHLWLTNSLIEGLAVRGEVTGFGVDYVSALPNADDRMQQLKLSFLASDPRRLLELLGDNEFIAPSIALSKVRLRHKADPRSDRSCNDEIRFNGKITVRGNDFASHLELTRNLSDRYGEHVERLEKESAIRRDVRDDVMRVGGAPLVINLRTPLSDLGAFTDFCFTGAPPFRLFGTPVELNKNFVRVRCVDLHVGETISFEVGHEQIRVYLPEGTCGNSVLRFLTNLQHSIDARARAVVTATGEVL